jgi:hypothetical protein
VVIRHDEQNVGTVLRRGEQRQRRQQDGRKNMSDNFSHG